MATKWGNHMNTTADGGLAERILNRPLPAWRDARVVRLRWTASLRNRAILSRQSVYGLNGYRTYRAYQLRSDYSEIEMDLRSVYEHFADQPWFDTDSAAEVVAILDSALHELEQADPNVHVVDDDLGRARRLMVWVSPPEWVDRRTKEIADQLHRSRVPDAQRFTTDTPSPKARRFWLDEAIGLVDRLETAESINRGLQVRRLERIRNVGVLAVFLLIGFAPILVSGSSQALWGRTDPGEAMQVTAWLTTLGIGLLGAIGALLSGLLQVRSSPVTFADYEVRGIEVALRVLVGAAVAVTVYYLLSWRAVPIDVTSAGTFLLVAFMSGFSERFFLKLLGLDAAALADSDHVEAGGTTRAPMPMAPTAA
jgi:hypothetical protein